MKNKLVQAMNSAPEVALTANGARTNFSSLKGTTDLFFLAGASRGKDITSVFSRAYAEDKDVATRILLWLRDAREGAGERQQFRNLLTYLIGIDKNRAERVLKTVPELGRFDDVVHFIGGDLNDAALKIIIKALKKDQNGLAGKWAPRKGREARILREAMELSPKQYRKLVVNLSNTVEQAMCANDWSGITYDHVPSVAAARYQAAFARHDPTGYEKYRASLVKGTGKINASAVFPYDVVKSLQKGNVDVANAQWKSLPNFMEKTEERVLPVVDTSGSMSMNEVSPGTTPMQVALSLGLYISERNVGPFQDFFVTFSARPELQLLKGTLKQRCDQLARAHWEGNTDLMAVFNLILSSAIRNNVTEKEMPTMVLILSDMEFDSCITHGRSTTAFNAIKEKYAAAGYTLPKVVFWNLNGRKGNSPVTHDERGTALISGFSPSILSSLFGGDDFDPTNVMLKTVMNSRYDY